MSENNNDPNPKPMIIDRNQDIQKTLRSIRNYLVIAALCWGVSLWIAGIILSAVGIACSIIALRKILSLEKSDPQIHQTTKMLKVISIICLCACIIAFIVTIVSIWIMFPIILEAVETGDFSQLGLNSSTGGNSGSSAW